MDEGQPIDWNDVKRLSESGELLGFLEKLPRHRWAEQAPDGETFLHYACCGSHTAVAALIASKAIDVNSNRYWGVTPAHTAAACTQPRALEFLCAAGANLMARDNGHYTPIDRALVASMEGGGETTRVLLANGVRLSTVCRSFAIYITSELVKFEQGVLRCCTAAVALMCVKKAGNLWRWDKFLLREVAIAVRATRCAGGWSEKNAAF